MNHNNKDILWDIENLRINYPPPPYAGEREAETEWGARNLSKLFLKTETYGNATENHILYVFGRRGSGKSAIALMLNTFIKKRTTGDYRFSFLLEKDQSFHDLSITFRFSPLADLPTQDMEYVLTNHWINIIEIGAMNAVIEDSQIKDSHPDEFKIIEQYLLEDNKINISPIKGLVKIIEEEFDKVDSAITKSAAAISRIMSRINSVEHKDAKDAMQKILHSEGKALIMIDTIDEYGLDDKISATIVSALIEACRIFYMHGKEYNIYTKVFFPTEIYAHLGVSNTGKMEGRHIFIHWKFHDLLKFIFIRYCWVLEKNKIALPEQYKKIIKQDKEKIREMFYSKYFPEKILNEIGEEEDTFSYIIRYTQKKPRQIIDILNSIIFIAFRIESIDAITNKCVEIGVRTGVPMLINDSFTVYNEIFPYAAQLTKKCLFKANSIFSESELDIYLKIVSGIKNIYNLSSDDIKKMLTEIGILGIIKEQSELKRVHKFIYKTVFEYQIKGTVNINPRVKIAIHPMYYFLLEPILEKDIYVYPYPFETEEYENLKKLGII